MAVIKGHTPNERGPRLGDGAGGTSERPSLKEADPVMRSKGYETTDIRLTATGTDVSAGEGDLYNFGLCNPESVGRYTAIHQGAASATADPLGTVAHCDFMLSESTAGVFIVAPVSDLEGGTATDDANDTRQSAATYTAVTDPDVSGAGSDSRATLFVARSDEVTDMPAAGYATPAVGDLVLLDATSAATRVHTVRRVG